MEDAELLSKNLFRTMDEQNKPTESKRITWNFIERNFLALSILVAGFLISASLFYANGGGRELTKAQIKPSGQNAIVEVSEDDDPAMGNKNAKVAVIEFSDYQCPFCRTFWRDSLPQLKKEYIDTGKVRFVYRDFPLSFHPMAAVSAQAAECAEEQGRYWEMHDKIFSEQDEKGQGTVQFTVQELKGWAFEVGLDANKFNKCLDSEKYKLEVEKDFNDGSVAGVSGTPTFFINGRSVVGTQPYSVLKNIIEEELKKK